MPKGVMLSHDNLTFTAQMLVETYTLRDKVRSDRESIFLCFPWSPTLVEGGVRNKHFIFVA